MDSKDFISDEILKQFKTGDELMSFLTSIQKRGIEKILEGEMDSHLGYEKHDKTGAPNSRNGFSNKKIKTSFGEDNIQVPRDRDGSFSPMLVPKRKGMAEGIENIIISLYSRGMSNSDIENQIRDLYNVEVSTSTISRITNAITEDIVAWQNRPLEDVYLIVWLDGIVFKVREQSKVINKTIYIAIGLRQDGIKEVLGLWLGWKESSSFWMSVLTDMKARGVNDILITATDNLNGFTETIKTVFPQSNTQICIVHQIRNACKFVSYKDRKPFTADMKKIYGAPTKQSAEAAFKDFAMTWEDKYPYSVQSWRTNWDELTTFFQLPLRNP
nr:IS256 family transposase [Candidatus Brachybacter algidus]